MGRVAVPLWLTILSDQLPVVALVGHYPTNKLIGRRLIPNRLTPLLLRDDGTLARLSRGYFPVWGRFLRITHPFATLLRAFDLHVLGTPPAFVLSQDQTLIKLRYLI